MDLAGPHDVSFVHVHEADAHDEGVAEILGFPDFFARGGVIESDPDRHAVVREDQPVAAALLFNFAVADEVNTQGALHPAGGAFVEIAAGELTEAVVGLAHRLDVPVLVGNQVAVERAPGVSAGVLSSRVVDEGHDRDGGVLRSDRKVDVVAGVHDHFFMNVLVGAPGASEEHY